MINGSRIRLDGIDAPSADQLCLNHTGERWTCGVAARDALMHHTDKKSWTCHVLRTDPREYQCTLLPIRRQRTSRSRLVSSGWALSYTRFSHDYDADEKAARDAKVGMWQGAAIAPWDWRIRNKKRPDDPVSHQAAAECARHSAGIGVLSGRAHARLHHQGQYQWRRRMHLSYAQKPLVCPDQDADQQGHPLVLLGRGGRTGRLPRNPALRCFSCPRRPA